MLFFHQMLFHVVTSVILLAVIFLLNNHLRFITALCNVSDETHHRL